MPGIITSEDEKLLLKDLRMFRYVRVTGTFNGIHEDAFLVTDIPREELTSLRKKHSQDAVIFWENDVFELITDRKVRYGKLDNKCDGDYFILGCNKFCIKFH